MTSALAVQSRLLFTQFQLGSSPVRLGWTPGYISAGLPSTSVAEPVSRPMASNQEVFATAQPTFTQRTRSSDA